MTQLETSYDPALPVEDIFYDADFNCRGEFTMLSVKDLADSITRAGGLISPVTVQPWSQQFGYKYRLVVGHRRYKAHTVFLKWPTIRAIICVGLTEREARLLNFTENLERKDLNILEEARAIRHLYPDGVTLRQAAAELKRPTRWVHVRLRLLEMPEPVQQQAAAGLLSAVNLDALTGIETPEDQAIAAGKIVEARQSRRHLSDLEAACKRSFHRRRTKNEINQMVACMLAAGITGLGPRTGAWCAGYLTDSELLQDIEVERAKPAASCDLASR